jgi:HEAT repeat protein
MIASLTCTAALILGVLPSESGRLEPGGTAVVEIPAVDADRTLSVLVTLERPSRLEPGVPLAATVDLGGATLRKTLHLGDPDVAWTIRLPAGAAGQVTLRAEPAQKAAIDYAVRVLDLGPVDPDGVAFEAEPNDAPESANPLTIGQTVYGLADHRPYLPLGDSPTDAEREAGKDWFRFDYEGDAPALAFFGLEFVDRDVPPDVRIYQLRDGQPVEYTRGIDPQSLQREKPPRPGANKFTTRVLTKGTYYVLVDACQPDYQLRTRLNPVPPYLGEDASDEAVADAARRAVRTAMDFQLGTGDSWHANTPRQGHPLDRVANPHHETSTCIACHPTHFTTQSALEAVANGYKVESPFALKFLTERLYNNPVPLYGHEGAVWARMIPAPANVLGRLSTITMEFEDRVAGSPRDHLHRSVAEFLKLVYDGRDTIPPDESNGNNPVSRYKVASDAWRQLDAIARRTGDERFAQTRDLVARLIPTGEPSNTRDLAAQTIGLCRSGREKNAEKIDANVKRLLELQRPDGNWSVKFDADYAITEMQTGESLYALALAGLGPDHPAIRKGVAALLRSQDEFGGWLDLNPYEQFRTPFRETQWALMALSRLYPGPGTRGWDGPLGPQPSALRADSASHLIHDLERIWDAPGNDLTAQVIAQLGHEAPLVRLAACEALARVGDRTAVAALVARLGDESKVVRRAAAEAVRLIGNRLNARNVPGETLDQVHLVAAIESALGSPDDRTRRGATRIFAAHFRELSQELGLADALLARLDDPDPVVQMQAAKGLWRWWYWRDDSALRAKIEDRLIAELAEPAHPWVRRNLTEALYILGDENIRYLYNNWLPTLARQADRDAATAAQHATVNRLAAKYVAALKGGNALQREGVLRALSEFHDRPAVVSGRVGNDVEPTLFYDDALPEVSSALVDQMASTDPTVRRLALQGLVTLRGYRDAALARAVLARRGDPEPSVREWAGSMAKDFPPQLEKGQADPALLAVVEELAGSDLPEARVAAMTVLGRWGPVEGADRSALILDGLADGSAEVRAAAIDALGAFPELRARREVRSKVVEALSDADPQARIAAVRLALDNRGYVSEGTLRKTLEDDGPAHRSALLDAIAKSKAYAADLRLVGVVSNALLDEDRGVRERALQAIQAHPALVNNPAIEASLRELTGSDNARQKEIATALLKSRGRSSGSGAAADVLDLAYFQAKVLPIFVEAGEDGQTCVGCHRSHTILKMVGPGAGGEWTPDRVRANYRASLRVVNLTSPSDSLILGKPTWEAAEEAEAQNDPTKKAHAGGVRFEPGSAEYRAILDWINGARLKAAGEEAEAGGSR